MILFLSLLVVVCTLLCLASMVKVAARADRDIDRMMNDGIWLNTTDNSETSVVSE